MIVLLIRQHRSIFKYIRSDSSLMVRVILVWLIGGLRPLLGPSTCRFYEGCTAYALRQLNTEPLGRALWHITSRLLLCNPFW